jgi:hypothetical protein
MSRRQEWIREWFGGAARCGTWDMPRARAVDWTYSAYAHSWLRGVGMSQSQGWIREWFGGAAGCGPRDMPRARAVDWTYSAYAHS